MQHSPDHGRRQVDKAVMGVVSDLKNKGSIDPSRLDQLQDAMPMAVAAAVSSFGGRKWNVPRPGKGGGGKVPSVVGKVLTKGGATIDSQKSVATIKRDLLPGEGKVDTYGQLKDKISLPGDNLSAHHIPHAQYMKTHGVKKADGISMMVEDPVPGAGGRHREIHKILQKQDPSLEPRQALAQGVGRVREVYQNDGVYTAEIRDSLQTVVEQSKQKHPKLFVKKSGES